MEQTFTPSQNHNRNKPMKNLQDFVLKLAQAHPNAPLAPPAETLLRDRLHRFVSDYRTPDHPPYSAMILNALQELNEKGGSSKKSISQFLEKRYDNLPWAHSVLLKHYLEETCESGEIVMTCTKKYQVAGSPNLITKVKIKPRRRKWRWECERQKHHQLKIRLIKKRNKQRDKKVDAIKKHQERDEKEQPSTTEGVHSEDQTTSLLSCVDGEKSSQSSHTILQSEPPSVIVAVNELKYPEEVRSEQENGPSAIEKADTSSAHTPEHKEDQTTSLLSCVDGEKSSQSSHSILQSEPPSVIVAVNEPKYPEEVRSSEQENGPSAIEKADISSAHTPEHKENKLSEHDQPEPSTPERPPGFESFRVENLHQFDSLQSECNMETPLNQQQVRDLIPINLKQMHHEKQQPQLIKADDVEVAQSVTKGSEITRKGRRGWRRKNMLKKSEQEEMGDVVGDVFEPSLTSKESELLQQTPSQQEEIFQGKQLRRSLRTKVAKNTNLKVAKTSNTRAALPPERHPVKVYTRQGTLSKKRPRSWPPSKPTDELQDSPKSQKKRKLLKQKLDAAAVENLEVVNECREEDFKQSVKLAECTSVDEKIAKPHLQKALKKLRLRRPPERRSARLLKQR